MRTGGILFHSTVAEKMTTAEATATAKATFSPPANIQRSPWHSPVPYLFGGLAAMLGLIAFALLILACSYWNREAEADEEKGDSVSAEKALPVFEEKFLVIMAGEVKPTFLATPTPNSRTTSLNKENQENVEEENMKKKNGRVEEAAQQSQLSQEQSQSNLS